MKLRTSALFIAVIGYSVAAQAAGAKEMITTPAIKKSDTARGPRAQLRVRFAEDNASAKESFKHLQNKAFERLNKNKEFENRFGIKTLKDRLLWIESFNRLTLEKMLKEEGLLETTYRQRKIYTLTRKTQLSSVKPIHIRIEEPLIATIPNLKGMATSEGVIHLPFQNKETFRILIHLLESRFTNSRTEGDQHSEKLPTNERERLTKWYLPVGLLACQGDEEALVEFLLRSDLIVQGAMVRETLNFMQNPSDIEVLRNLTDNGESVLSKCSNNLDNLRKFVQEKIELDKMSCPE